MILLSKDGPLVPAKVLQDPGCAVWRGLICLLLLGFWSPAFGFAPSRPLTRISEIRALSPEEADLNLPVHIRATVTGCAQYEMYIQDDENALFVSPLKGGPLYNPGDYVEFYGHTQADPP